MTTPDHRPRPDHDADLGPDNATLGSIGEVATLRRIFPLLPDAHAALLGPGDDAAVVAAPDGRFVVTTDMMIHGPDFRWAWSTPHDLGWKAAASNLADVAAMGARPTALVVAIAAPARTPVAVLEGVARGLAEGCASMASGCGVVGGDLSVSSVFTVAVTAFGDLEGRAPVLRSGARPGDVVALAGVMGGAATGLRTLFEGAVDGEGRPDATRVAALRAADANVEAQLRPTPPIVLGTVAAIAGASAMLDVSDGLALDAGRLAAASGVSVDFDSSTLGADAAAALAGGEDHALLACFSPTASLPNGFVRIGVAREGAGVCVDGAPYEAPSPSSSATASTPDAAGGVGWDPYRNWDGGEG